VFRGHSLNKWLVVALAALLVGFAPVYHALCVQPDTTTSSSTHVMADGSVMEMHKASEIVANTPMLAKSLNGASLQAYSPLAQSDLPFKGNEPLTVIVVFLLPACLLLVGLFLAIRKSTELRRLELTLRNLVVRPPIRSFRPHSVDLLALGISRT
jgi:hypothetical protein